MNEPTPSNRPDNELSRLLIKLVDGALRPEEAETLRTLLRTDPAALGTYVNYLSTHSMLGWRFAGSGWTAGDSGAPVEPLAVDLAGGSGAGWQSPSASGSGASLRGAASLRDESALHGEKAIRGVRLVPDASPWGGDEEIPAELPAPPVWQGRKVFSSSTSGGSRWLRRGSGLAAAVAVAMGVAFLFNQDSYRTRPTLLSSGSPTVVFPTPAAPEVEIVASVTTMIRAGWSDPEIIPGTELAAGRKLVLQRGAVELSFVGGARVVVEAPARFSVDTSAAMTLEWGRVVPTASGRAAGFVVRTPTADITDLGTQFGVGVDGSGVVQVHVFEGRVQAELKRSGPATQPAAIEPPPTLLRAGDAGRVAASGVTITPGAADPQAFVRKLSPDTDRLDLVDLTAGGDGTTARRGSAIDSRDGAVGLHAPIGNFQVTGTTYQRVAGLSVVDGVFIPNGTTAVSSTGVNFAFPATSGTSFNHIWSGPPVPWPEGASGPFNTVLGAVDYAQPGRGMIVMHSNRGLTIDLAQVRRLHPGRPIRGLRATLGNTCDRGRAPTNGKSDAFVLLDGRLRFHKPAVGPGDPPVVVDIPLANNERYLTFATTDAGDGVGYDWMMIGDPLLLLGPEMDTSVVSPAKP